MNDLTFHAAVEYVDKSGKTIVKEFYAPDNYQSYYECKEEAETLVIDLAFDGVKSVFTDTNYSDDKDKWTHYEYAAFDKHQFLKWFTEAEYEWLRTQDHSDTGYYWYELLYNGSSPETEETKDLYAWHNGE